MDYDIWNIQFYTFLKRRFRSHTCRIQYVRCCRVTTVRQVGMCHALWARIARRCSLRSGAHCDVQVSGYAGETNHVLGGLKTNIHLKQVGWKQTLSSTDGAALGRYEARPALADRLWPISAAMQTLWWHASTSVCSVWQSRRISVFISTFLIFVRSAFTGCANSDVSGDHSTPKQRRHWFMPSWCPVWTILQRDTRWSSKVCHEQATTSRPTQCTIVARYSSTPSYTGLMFQIEWYKLGSLVHRCLQGTAPNYLIDCCTPVSDVVCQQRLRSASRLQLVVPRHRLTTLGRRAFAVMGPTIWNSLPVPDDLRAQQNSDCFCRHLKAFLFSNY